MESILRKGMIILVQTFSRLLGWILAISIALWLLGGSSAETHHKQLQVGSFMLEQLPSDRLEYGSWSSDGVWEIDIHGAIGGKHWASYLDRLREQAAFFKRLKIESQHGLKPLKAVVLSINSPGGSTTAGFALYHLIQSLKHELDVPVYTYVEGLCASAAYLIASASDHISINEVGIVGSIGAYYRAMNAVELLDKVGVKFHTRSVGEGKAQLDPTRRWSEDEFNDSDTLVAHSYDLFVRKVAENRPLLSEEEIRNDLGAHVFDASRGLLLGLVDSVGTREELFKRIAQEQKLSEYIVLRCADPLGLLKSITGTYSNYAADLGKMLHVLAVSSHSDILSEVSQTEL